MAILLLALKIIAALVVLALVYGLGHRAGFADGVYYTIEAQRQPENNDIALAYARRKMPSQRQNTVYDEWKAQQKAANDQGVF